MYSRAEYTATAHNHNPITVQKPPQKHIDQLLSTQNIQYKCTMISLVAYLLEIKAQTFTEMEYGWVAFISPSQFLDYDAIC